MNVIELLFLLAFGIILHSYLLYPLSMRCISFFVKKDYSSSRNFPSVSVIISAYNEERVIEKTIKNFFSLQYPQEKLEVIIGSDGSTDSTNNIINKLHTDFPNLKPVLFNYRRGKKAVVNDLIPLAGGDILIFSDSNTIYQKYAIANLVKYYADSRIGGVCGRLELLSEVNCDKRNKEKVYWGYESWLKNVEGSLGTLIGANGGIYSIRKSLYVNMPENIPVVDDLFISLKVIEQGKDFIYSKDAVAREFVAPSLKWEYDRKVRIIPRSLETIKQVRSLLWGKKFLISYGLWSHKIIRWFSPLIFILIFLINIFLLGHQNAFVLTFFFQVLFLFFVFAGYLLSRLNINIKFLQLCLYFFIINSALLKGMINFLFKKHQPIWQPTPRK